MLKFANAGTQLGNAQQIYTTHSFCNEISNENFFAVLLAKMVDRLDENATSLTVGYAYAYGKAKPVSTVATIHEINANKQSV